VMNPPGSGKYQYWTNEAAASSLEEFIAGAKETPGSWWGDWLAWLTAPNPARAPGKVPAKGARLPGKGKLEAIEDAPGRYVKSR
jgi:polyhydroxyalkanoate synthase subunit PhaC